MTSIDGDQGTTSKDLVQVPIEPVTRARAKKFKDVLNGLIQELWAQANSWRPSEHDPRGQQRIVEIFVFTPTKLAQNWSELVHGYALFLKNPKIPQKSKDFFGYYWGIFVFRIVKLQNPNI